MVRFVRNDHRGAAGAPVKWFDAFVPPTSLKSIRRTSCVTFRRADLLQGGATAMLREEAIARLKEYQDTPAVRRLPGRGSESSLVDDFTDGTRRVSCRSHDSAIAMPQDPFVPSTTARLRACSQGI